MTGPFLCFDIVIPPRATLSHMCNMGKARPCYVPNIRKVVEQCRAAKVPCFVKQLGARPVDWGETIPGIDGVKPMSLKSRKGGNPAEWPEPLRVREMPGVARP